MTRLQKAQLKLSQSRVAINELAAKPDRTEEENAKLSELRAKHSDLETEYREALEDAGAPERREHRIENGAQTPEQREFLELEGQVTIGDYLTGRPEGAALEYRSAVGNRVGVPLSLLLTEAERVELRADVASTSPANVSINSQAILAKLREESITDFLGVSMPSVAVGEASFPIITGTPNVGIVDAGAALESTAVTLSANRLPPRRLQARISWLIEDEFSLAGFTDALRREARRVLMEQVDKMVISGKASAPAVDGFLRTLTAATDPTAASAMNDLVEEFVPSPPWSSRVSEPRLLCNRDMVLNFMGLNSSGTLNWDRDLMALDRSSVGEQLRASAFIPAATGTPKIAEAIRFAGPRGAGRAVAPIWVDGLAIEDLVSDSAKGLRHATFVTMSNFAILDSGPWTRVKFQFA